LGDDHSATSRNPSYSTSGKNDYDHINVIPNPYYADNQLERDRYSRVVLFTQLPLEASIVIYKGISPNGQSSLKNLVSGGTIKHPLAPIRTLTKNDSGGFFRWDLKDSFGLHILSGFYRAYFYNESNQFLKFVDMYIISPDDCANWQDPTGWLREDWNQIIYDSGQGQVYRKICG